MNLEIGFDLPYAALVRCVAPSAPLRVAVSATNMREQQMEQIEAHVVIWGAAAVYGMGAGRYAPPTPYAGTREPEALFDVKRSASAGRIAFEATGVACDPHYSLVLLHKLLCLATLFDPITSVEIEIPVPQPDPQPLPLLRAARSALPELSPPPFAYTIDLDSGAQGREIEIDFVRSLTPADAEVLADLLATWLAQAAQGGYVNDSFPPERFSVFPGGEPDIFADEVRWSLSDISVDERVVYSLLHALTVFGQRHVPVREFIIA